jgi:hypothetical protein
LILNYFNKINPFFKLTNIYLIRVFVTKNLLPSNRIYLQVKIVLYARYIKYILNRVWVYKEAINMLFIFGKCCIVCGIRTSVCGDARQFSGNILSKSGEINSSVFPVSFEQLDQGAIES